MTAGSPAATLVCMGGLALRLAAALAPLLGQRLSRVPSEVASLKRLHHFRPSRRTEAEDPPRRVSAWASTPQSRTTTGEVKTVSLSLVS